MSGRKKITRRRKIRSCHYCYSHKLKCDKKEPCSSCLAIGDTTECIYGFSKESEDSNNDIDNELGEQSRNNQVRKCQKLNKNSNTAVLFKSKYFYPFFASSINDKILLAESYGQFSLTNNFTRNPIHNFNRYSNKHIDIDGVLQLLPSSKQLTINELSLYMKNVHPIIPIIDQNIVLDMIDDIYNSVNNDREVSALYLILIMAILFCISYANVASGATKNLYLCDSYYSAYKYLLDEAEFPFKQYSESLQAYLLVNFIIDPNMVQAPGYSSMLVRIGQQLGLHTMNLDVPMDTYHLKLLWNFILYVEGSSSVVCGLPFSASKLLLNAVPLYDTDVRKSDYSFPVEFTLGRIKINKLFYDVMELSQRKDIIKPEYLILEKNIDRLYDEINNLNVSIKVRQPDYADYFISTLNVFMYRLHLRHSALICLQDEKDKMVNKLSRELTPVQSSEILNIFDTAVTFQDDIIPISILLLLQTYKRLIQNNVKSFLWYTKGSTVMQYLFIVMKDIYQSPDKSFHLETFPISARKLIGDDIKEVIRVNPVLFKYVLVESLIKLLERKLASLWNNQDLYNFFVIKTVKETLWTERESFLNANKSEMCRLMGVTLFSVGHSHLYDLASIDFTELLKQWQSGNNVVQMEKVLTNWLGDFANF
ncbi:hypothetical protein Kpol_1061p37 [Vanderwaltozyma polyspora DSM 70294]|uniref:Zn(2)-C6 fungal-type domain-containing protein n=1 Tax=Vanderwaltozyma polyspora (strain ATCC 22028 / DSM 70294 / BCRC 21397 / CBS 2163 / NBRC 10782 / NRRL Y-8283 / UCD 57-17) TaxID=436907 RepID=A7TJG2_VANPO|nr:uncharacterized protein Kpol_1061p37 [Vanderwaltozyma polyspora DSM 70294]EDO17612.1 hypothetical protein Kpol_1061p37 [Vanderwaltozyma polyspora DSM 70294]